MHHAAPRDWTRALPSPGLLGGILLALALGCATGSETAPYESDESLRASEILPPELLQGPHHRVEEQVASDGLARTYTVSSDFGTFQASDEAELRERIHEIEALAALEASRSSEDFAAAAQRADAARQKELVAVPGLPVGARPSPAGPARYLDVDTLKRRIASELGIDPYTTNAALQAELERTAWVAAAGGMASLSLPGEAAAESEPLPGASGRSSELLRSWSEDDLERLNRIELAAMGVEESLREKFLEHPSYSTRTGTSLVDSLSAMEGTEDRAAFIAAALAARSEHEARSFEHMARLIRQYGDSEGELAKIVTMEGRVAAYAADGTLVVPVPADNAFWSQRVENFARSMSQASAQEPGAAGTRFLVSGRVSERARDEMRELGIEVREGLLSASSGGTE